MSFVMVCPLSEVAASVSASGASRLISLVDDGTPVARPQSIPAENHLFLAINDISEPMDGMVLADEAHVQALIDFLRAWAGHDPLVIHCYAGISRSTAAAFIALCVARPNRDEREIAARLRSASAFATPNRGWWRWPTACLAATAAWSTRSPASAVASWPSRACRS